MLQCRHGLAPWQVREKAGANTGLFLRRQMPSLAGVREGAVVTVKRGSAGCLEPHPIRVGRARLNMYDSDRGRGRRITGPGIRTRRSRFSLCHRGANPEGQSGQTCNHKCFCGIHGQTPIVLNQ